MTATEICEYYEVPESAIDAVFLAYQKGMEEGFKRALQASMNQLTIVDETPFEYELVKNSLTGHYVVAPF